MAHASFIFVKMHSTLFGSCLSVENKCCMSSGYIFAMIFVSVVVNNSREEEEED